uniref:Uncharacterized protein n=1 Tax=Lepeophtheirus salmonis TaxID=72036 RepID=A0A0K2UTZ0_LEPSM
MANNKEEVYCGRKRHFNFQVNRGKKIQYGSYDRKLSSVGETDIIDGMKEKDSKFMLKILADLASTPVVLLGDVRLSHSESQKYLSEYFVYKRLRSK